MRTASFGSALSLLGSLALHGSVVLVLFLAAHRQPDVEALPQYRPDAWSGNAVEVDAVTGPEAENAAPAPGTPAPAEASEPSAALAAPAEAIPSVALGELPTEHAPPAQPKPKPARPRTPKPEAHAEPNSADSASRSEGASKSDAPNSGATSGSYGSQGLPPGVSSLPGALTRVIPAAGRGDPIWQSLPAGPQRPFFVRVRVGADGQIAEAEVLESHDGSEVPPQFKHLRDRLLAFLGAGQFALQNNARAGTDLFKITITLSDLPLPEDEAPAALVNVGSEAPQGKKPGHAHFTLASGRHFEAVIEVLGSPAKPAKP